MLDIYRGPNRCSDPWVKQKEVFGLLCFNLVGSPVIIFYNFLPVFIELNDINNNKYQALQDVYFIFLYTLVSPCCPLKLRSRRSDPFVSVSLRHLSDTCLCIFVHAASFLWKALEWIPGNPPRPQLHHYFICEIFPDFSRQNLYLDLSALTPSWPKFYDCIFHLTSRSYFQNIFLMY